MEQRLLSAPLLFVLACGVDAPAEHLPTPIDEPQDQPAHVDHPADELVAELTLDNGNVVRFFANADGSAGVLEESQGTAVFSDDPEGETWTVADVFWGLTDKRAVIPEALLRHHELMAADGDVPPTFMHERGRRGRVRRGLRFPGARARRRESANQALLVWGGLTRAPCGWTVEIIQKTNRVRSAIDALKQFT